MMGDYVGNSHDSRAWDRWTFKFADGRPDIVCEGQDVVVAGREIREAAEVRGRKEVDADYFLKADKHGYEHFIYRKDLANDPDREKEPDPFVHRDFIVGKALWIWWPPGRWFRLIR
jgi:hypothetical protein